MHSLVLERYLPKEWPAEMAALAREMTLWDLCLLMSGDTDEQTAKFGMQADRMRTCPMLDLVVDWYCLRQSPAQAPGYIPAEKLDLYRSLADAFGDVDAPAPHEPRDFFAIFLGVLRRSLERASSSS
jgi:hypothetical protein